MKQSIFTIIENEQLTASVWQMRLVGDTSAITTPGQFVNILLDGCYLRRPHDRCSPGGQGLPEDHSGGGRHRPAGVLPAGIL